MSDPKRPSPEHEFEAWLKAAGRAIRQQKGQCPEADTLDRFLAGALSDEEAEKVRSHIAACGVCDLAVEKMKAFEQVAAEETSDVASTARAYAVEGKILESLKQSKPAEDAGLPMGARSVIDRLKYATDLLFWCLRRPAFAYLVALALVYPAYRGLRPRPQAPLPHLAAVETPKTPSSPPVMVAPPPLELDRVRGGGSQNKVVRLAPNESAFVLGFPAPTRAGYSYLAEVRHEKGGSLVARAQLPPNRVGYFNLVFDRRPFDPGAYTLSVFETRSSAPQSGRPGSGKLVVQYEFSVEAEPAPPH
jgi:hypothetical protein